ncbi:type-2 ice-structuring protein-like [Stylophora pistillata]|nr:type-2 ice-structuring protein-like [Stylophora pistillata]
MCGQRWLAAVGVAFTICEFYWGCDAVQCNSEWKEWNKACFKFVPKYVPFSIASAACKKDQANLVSIHSLEENEFVRTLAGNSTVFIGLTDGKTEGVFAWSDGSTVTYENWEADEPDNGLNISDCVILDGLSSRGKWNDTPCIMWYAYVCKFIQVQPFNGKDKSVMKREQSFINYEWNALINHVLYKEFTSSAIHCAFLCMNNPACKTINHKSQHADGEGECQLNSVTAEEFPLDLVYSSHSTYIVPIVRP